MLQQTRVETVIPYYHRFMTAFPTLTDLAAADEDDVLKLWQGLGYYSRARNLHQAAKDVVQNHGGGVPAQESALASLRGVGPYTRGALLSIAFGQPYPAVDGNVLRVMSRYLALDSPIETRTVQKAVYDKVRVWMETVPPSDLTQALMELGALVCLPRNPQCTACPLQNECLAAEQGRTAEIPVRRPKAPRKIVDVSALWLESPDGLWIKQRSREGLLGGLWQLPAVETERPAGVGPTPEEELRIVEKLYTQVATDWVASDRVAERKLEFVLIAQERHIFSHLEWYVRVWRPLLIEPGPPAIQNGEYAIGSYRCVPRCELDSLAVPRVYERVMQSILNRKG